MIPVWCVLFEGKDRIGTARVEFYVHLLDTQLSFDNVAFRLFYHDGKGGMQVLL